jgi:hypothetical protein
MSMNGHLLLVSDDDIAALAAEPWEVHGLIQRRVHKAAEPVDHVDLDKNWHALHFLLTGTAWEGEPPLDVLVRGGEDVGEEDVGYGPARLLHPAPVTDLHRALDGLPFERLLERFDGVEMDALEIYPSGGWSAVDPRAERDVGGMADAYEQLRQLVRKGAAERRGLLVWLS